MFCVNCSAQLNEGTKFCTSCGLDIGQSANVVSTIPKNKGDRPITINKLATPQSGVEKSNPPNNLVPLLFIFCCTALYVYFELRYNLALLQLFSQPEPSKAAVDSLSQEGKVLAALGITWAIGRGLLARIEKWQTAAGIFLVSVFCVYLGLSALYDKVISDLSPATKVNGFHLAAYRKALIAGTVEDPEIPLPKSHGTLGSIVMTSFPLIMFDDRYMSPARIVLELKAKDYEKYYRAKVERSWPRYNDRMIELRRGYAEYLDGSRQVDRYRNTPFRQKALNDFRSRSGGLTPDSKASMDSFIAQLRAGNGPRSKEFLRGEEDTVFVENEGTAKQKPVKGGELPKFMSRDQYFEYFGKKIESVKLSVLPTERTVEGTEGIHDINSAVFVPPMAMITSLVSVLANVAALFLILCSIGALSLRSRVKQGVNRALSILGPFFTIGFIIAALSLAPPSIFSQSASMASLEKKMQGRVGWAGQLWSRAAAVQFWISEKVSFKRGA